MARVSRAGGRGDGRQQVMDLLDRADAARATGDLVGAVAGYRDATGIVRELAEAEPTAADHRQQLGSMLYTLGELLIEAGDPSAAISTLLDAENAYENWAGLKAGDTSLASRAASYIADVRLRRARAHAAVDHRASALVDAQAAVLSYLRRFSGRDADPLGLDAARVLSHHATITLEFGDPDVAVAAADWAIRLYLKRAATINRDVALRQQHLRTFAAAAQVAAAIHAAYGRTDLARAAADLAGQMPFRAMDPPGTGEIRRRLTLAEVLTDAGAIELRDALVAPAADCTILTPMHRCDPQLAATRAAQLADLAEPAVDRDRRAGLRLALEAHALFAGASEQQTTQMRHQFGDSGARWAGLLLRCARAAEAGGDRDLALDLASWMGGVAQNLAPHAFVDPAVRTLVRECLEYHAHLLAANGDAAGADRATATAKIFEDPDR